MHLLATVVTANSNDADFCFLVAVIAAILSVLFGAFVVDKRTIVWPVGAMIVLFFVALGLLFAY